VGKSVGTDTEINVVEALAGSDPTRSISRQKISSAWRS
jgi:hypothetical protein